MPTAMGWPSSTTPSMPGCGPTQGAPDAQPPAERARSAEPQVVALHGGVADLDHGAVRG